MQLKVFGPGLLVAVLAATSMAACGGQASGERVTAASSGVGSAPAPAPSSGPPIRPMKHPWPGPVWTPAPAAPGEKVNDRTSSRTRPAPPGTTPKISQAQAEAIAKSSPSGGFITGQLDAELVLYTNHDIPPRVVAENAAEYGPDPGAVKNQLTWLLTYFDSPPAAGPGGITTPGGMQTTPGNIRTSATCDLIVAVNADTGTVIDADQICHGTPPDQRPTPTATSAS